MLFHVTWAFKDTGEEGARRSLALLAKWQPPAGAEFQGFYGFADGNGGVALIEADSAATVALTTSPWTPWLRQSPSATRLGSCRAAFAMTSAGRSPRRGRGPVPVWAIPAVAQ